MSDIFIPENIILNAHANDKFEAITLTGNILKNYFPKGLRFYS